MKGSNKVRKLELKEKLYKQRFLAPNLVTVGSLFCGLLTVIYASSGRFEKAVIAVVIAMVLDGMDGRVARRLNATSRFGVEFDSLADLVSFGVAPAIVMYHWCFQIHADEFGVFVCFIYLMCAASRLARFNISSDSLHNFQGLPTPAAAGMLVALVYLYPAVTADRSLIALVTALMVLISYLMVSRIEFISIKVLKVNDLRTFLALGALVAITWYKPWIGFLVIMTVYCLSGPAKLFYDWYVSKRIAKQRKSEDKLVS